MKMSRIYIIFLCLVFLNVSEGFIFGSAGRLQQLPNAAEKKKVCKILWNKPDDFSCESVGYDTEELNWPMQKLRPTDLYRSRACCNFCYYRRDQIPICPWMK